MKFSDYGSMTLSEWRAMFDSLPNPSFEELAKFIERKRREDAGREASEPQMERMMAETEAT